MRGSGLYSPFCLGLSRIAASAGLSVSELNAEITVETAMVSANCRKNCPVTPLMNAHGMNTALSTSPTAMTGPDTRTTQLFVNLADNRRLDAEGFAPVGVVVEGMDVVERLYAGYGEAAGGGMRGGRQAPVFEGGNAYLDRAYPRLDRLRRAVQ